MGTDFGLTVLGFRLRRVEKRLRKCSFVVCLFALGTTSEWITAVIKVPADDRAGSSCSLYLNLMFLLHIMNSIFFCRERKTAVFPAKLSDITSCNKLNLII